MATIAMLGSGEFLPWSRPVEEWCLERATAPGDRVLVVPTASAPEGEDVFRRWAELGTAHYRALGLSPEVLELRVRDDASRAEIVDAVAGARLVFFSGGNPGYLVETVAGTPFWEAVADAGARGTALGGCSAGAVAFGSLAPFVSELEVSHWVAGLALLSRGYVMPHFDMLDVYREGLRAFVLENRPAGDIGIGLDENTALCGDGETWTVFGRGEAWVFADDREAVTYRDGAMLTLPLGLRTPSH